MVHINIFWQLSIGLILASIIAEIYYLNTKQDTKEDTKSIKEKARKEKLVNKSLDKLNLQTHEEKTTLIGVDYDKVKAVKINDNAKHVLIAGTTGAGKTVSISNFIENAMQKGYPVLAVDGKGDLGKGSLLHYMESLSKKYNRKLYVINFVNPETSDYYNPFKDAGMTEAKDMLIGMNNWSEEHYKVNTERYLQQLIKILNMNNTILDLNTIIKYSPTQFQKLIDEMKDNGTLLIDEYTKITEIIKSTATIVSSAMARFATTAESEAGIIFNSKGIDIYTALKEKANILIILDSLGKPELSKQVGRLAILDAKKAVGKLFGDATRKLFILDEFNVYASDVAIDLLNKSRSANVTCVPAVQSLSDLDKAGGVALRNQVIENCNNYIIMRQNSSDSSMTWEKIIGQEEIDKYTYNVQKKAGLFGTRAITSDNTSMHTAMESKHTATEIQELQQGQSIFISKDQGIDKRIKMRSVKIDELNFDIKEHEKKLTPTEKPIKPNEPIKYTENLKMDKDTFDDVLK
jgi:type IV secretory pathway TraG/TraD family ATPase VirD4